jgi:hypothetical protein
MELASMLAGERFSDHPVSVCPIVGAILRAYNDDLDDRRRHDLYRYAAEAVNTRGTYRLQLSRAQVALDWAAALYEKRGWLRRRPQRPRRDDGPDEIAFYVVRATGRRHSDESHAAVLALIDQLIAMGFETAPVQKLGIDLVEQRRDALEDLGGGSQLIVGELREGSAPAGLLASPPLLDHLPAALGQRSEHDALVLG